MKDSALGRIIQGTSMSTSPIYEVVALGSDSSLI